jgi:hypothetical protein
MVKALGNKTLFLDFLPMEIGIIAGYNARIQFYTVPGDDEHDAARRLVLKGAEQKVISLTLSSLQKELKWA